ncbi:SURF1 family protein [Sphingomonas glaciei]|uniref:SURF1-like protein n=1 Tax=Sphingomonas glaciei TaxID=2938948 RepID=A0ABY5MVE1_9SPHN|nr:SURF1 family protein [Sphingomonas glaciei]UUR07949.1 SURF1 family protein [Sphingomonas glaciei]
MRRSRAKRGALIALCAGLALLFAGLGVWQVERLAWKRDLIARVDARLAAPAVALEARETWPEYSKVWASGRFDHARETLVDALTERGKGYWVLTPLDTGDRTILVNRGFVPSERAAASTRPQGQLSGDVVVTGLVRLTEPGGRFLRANQPSADRWYSRDVATIAAARDLSEVAPFFIDADATANPGGLPIGGLTVVSFRNSHLVYALTWFGLAGLCLFGLVLTLRTTHNGG